MPKVKFCIECKHFRTVDDGYDKNTCLKGWKYSSDACPFYEPKLRSKK